MHTNKAQSIMDGVLADIARMYDMPELIGAKVIKTDVGAQKLARFTVNVDIQPRGQLASFVETLNVGVTLYAEPDATGYIVDLKPSYQHPGGGSNGYTVRLIAVTSGGIGEPEKYVGLLSDQLSRTITQRHIAANIALVMQGQSGAEIEKMYAR